MFAINNSIGHLMAVRRENEFAPMTKAVSHFILCLCLFHFILFCFVLFYCILYYFILKMGTLNCISWNNVKKVFISFLLGPA